MLTTSLIEQSQSSSVILPAVAALMTDDDGFELIDKNEILSEPAHEPQANTERANAHQPKQVWTRERALKLAFYVPEELYFCAVVRLPL